MFEDFELVANIVVQTEEKGGKVSYDTYFNIQNADQEHVKQKLMGISLQGGEVFRIHGYAFPLLVMYVCEDEYPSPLDASLRTKERTFYCMDAWLIKENGQYVPVDWFE